jgi:hypothetical protein
LKLDKRSEIQCCHPFFLISNFKDPDFGKDCDYPEQIIQVIQPTRCNSFTSLLLGVYVWLNMFRASPRPSSVDTTALGASGFTVGEKRLEGCWSWSGLTTSNNLPVVSIQP